jgi:hypothetical protein
VTESVVRLSLRWILEDLVALLDRRELRWRVRVVVQVGMVLPDLLPERILDLLLARVLVDLEEVVEVEVVGHVVGGCWYRKWGRGLYLQCLVSR